MSRNRGRLSHRPLCWLWLIGRRCWRHNLLWCAKIVSSGCSSSQRLAVRQLLHVVQAAADPFSASGEIWEEVDGYAAVDAAINF